jgi:hypothetical protein
MASNGCWTHQSPGYCLLSHSLITHGPLLLHVCSCQNMHQHKAKTLNTHTCCRPALEGTSKYMPDSSENFGPA